MKKCLNKGVVELNIKDKEECPRIEPFGLCTVTDCLACSNSDYIIVMANEKILRDFCKEECEEKYLIEFFDAITCDIVDYLLDEGNDYRITRISDGVVLRYSNEDLILMGREPRVKKESIEKEEAPKGLVKRFKDRFKQTKTSY